MMKTDRNLKPIYLPVKCVVCNGFGTVNWGKAECHACRGKGYILVKGEGVRRKDGEIRR